MAYIAGTAAAIKGATKKADFDQAFDNTTRIKDEFDYDHGWTATGAVDGLHDGISQYVVTGTQSGTTSGVILSEYMSALQAGGLWVIEVHASQSAVKSAVWTVLVDENTPTSGIDYYVSNAPNYNFTGHFANHGYSFSVPVIFPYLRVRVFGDPAVLEISLFTTVTDPSTYYNLAGYRLSNFGV